MLWGFILSTEIILELLREKINFLDLVEPGRIDVELLNIMEFIKFQPKLNRAYNLILEEEREFKKLYEEIKKEILEKICELLICEKEIIHSLKNTGKIDKEIDNIQLWLIPSLIVNEFSEDFIEEIKKILKAETFNLIYIARDYIPIIENIRDIISIYFESSLQNEDKCEELKNYYNKYLDIKQELNELILDKEKQTCLNLLIKQFESKIAYWYDENECPRPIELKKITGIQSLFHILSLHLADIYVYLKTKGLLHESKVRYLELLGKMGRYKESNITYSIDKIEEMIASIDFRTSEKGSFFSITSQEKSEIIKNIKRLELALRERIILPEANLEILEQFRFKAQNYDRKRFYNIIQKEQNLRNKEAKLTMNLCNYLHDLGYMPIYNPKLGYEGFSTSIPDVIDIKTLKYTIIIEVKVILGDKRKRILRGFNQIYHYVTNLSEYKGYYLIFNGWDGEKIILPNKITFENGITIYIMVIDITNIPPSMQEFKEYNISEEELRGSI